MKPNVGPNGKRLTAKGIEKSDIDMFGFFKQPTVGKDGLIYDRFTWRGDLVQREYAKNGRVEDTETMAILTKFFEVFHRLSTIIIDDNRANAEFPILLKIVKGKVILNNLSGTERGRFNWIWSELEKQPKYSVTYNAARE